MQADPELHEGWIDAGVAAELPGLRLRWLVAGVGDERTSRAMRGRLRHASDRLRGARAITLRTEPVPAAYRAFLRGTGVDPDVRRSPIEQAALDRLMVGGYAPEGRVPDALLLGLVETGVCLLAFDDARLDGPLGIRPSRARGELVVADAAGVVAELLGPVAPGCLPGRGTRQVRVAAVQVPGVPDVHVEEALWIAAEGLQD